MKYITFILAYLLILLIIIGCEDKRFANDSLSPQKLFSLKFSSLKEAYKQGQANFELDLKNIRWPDAYIEPWYHAASYRNNSELFIRTAGTNEPWIHLKDYYIRDNQTRSYKMVIPPSSKLTFRIDVRLDYPPGEYEVYAALSAYPDVVTPTETIRLGHGRFTARKIIGDKWGYVDFRGMVVIPPQFEHAENFFGGLGRIKLNGKYGFVNHQGDLVVEPKFEDAFLYWDENGLIEAKIKGEWVHIDLTGKVRGKIPLGPYPTPTAAWTAKELLLWDGLKGFAFGPEKNEWDHLPKNPHTSESIQNPRLLSLDPDKTLACYWQTEKRLTLCLDQYYSDKKQWKRITTFSADILKPADSADPNVIPLYVGGMTSVDGTAFVCIGNSYGLSKITCFIMDNNNQISFLPRENAPVTSRDVAVYVFGNKLLYWGYVNVAYNQWNIWNLGTNTWQESQKFERAYDFAHTFTGDEVYIFGGAESSAFGWIKENGWIYSFKDNTWREWTLGENAPCGRRNHGMCWTGKEIIVWGGYRWADPPTEGSLYLNNGAAFNPLTSEWRPISMKNAPSPRSDFLCIWTGKEMIIWGGRKNQLDHYDSYAYYPEVNTWRKLPDLEDFIKKSYQTAR